MTSVFSCPFCGYTVNDIYEGGEVLLYEKGKEWNYCPNCGVNRNAPTVEAIPVDWLREHRKQTRHKRSARIIEQLVRLYQEEQER